MGDNFSKSLCVDELEEMQLTDGNERAANVTQLQPTKHDELWKQLDVEYWTLTS